MSKLWGSYRINYPIFFIFSSFPPNLFKDKCSSSCSKLLGSYFRPSDNYFMLCSFSPRKLEFRFMHRYCKFIGNFFMKWFKFYIFCKFPSNLLLDKSKVICFKFELYYNEPSPKFKLFSLKCIEYKYNFKECRFLRFFRLSITYFIFFNFRFKFKCCKFIRYFIVSAKYFIFSTLSDKLSEDKFNYRYSKLKSYFKPSLKHLILS